MVTRGNIDHVYERVRQLVTAVVSELDDGSGDLGPDVVEETLSRHADSIADMVTGLTMAVVADLYEDADEADEAGDLDEPDGVVDAEVVEE